MWDDNVELWVSRQVLREYLVQVTRPQITVRPLSIQQAVSQVNMIQSLFRVADETAEVTQKLLELLQQFPTGGKNVHDANIVATMLVNGVNTLLSQNVDDIKRFVPMIKIVPLVEDIR